mgnify:CR=1 FL=1
MVYDTVPIAQTSVSASCVLFLMIRRPPRSTLDRSSAASDVYKRQALASDAGDLRLASGAADIRQAKASGQIAGLLGLELSLIHISEPTRPY